MRILVIPDIHLKTWIFDRAEAIMKSGKADRAVCLMDMPDDWGMEFQLDRYNAIFDCAILIFLFIINIDSLSSCQFIFSI